MGESGKIGYSVSVLPTKISYVSGPLSFQWSQAAHHFHVRHAIPSQGSFKKKKMLFVQRRFLYKSCL